MSAIYRKDKKSAPFKKRSSSQKTEDKPLKASNKNFAGFKRKSESSAQTKQNKRKPLPANAKCKIQHLCQACAFINEDYNTSFQGKYNKALEALKTKISLDAVELLKPQESSQKYGYRTSVKLAIREPYKPTVKKSSKFAKPHFQTEDEAKDLFDIGLFQRGSHKLISLEECPVQHTQINRLVKEIKRLLNSSDLKPYNETTQKGDLRYLLIRMAHVSEDFMVTFVATDRSCYQSLRNLTKQLKERFNVSSSFLNINPDNTNKILGSKTKKILGADKLRETLCHFNLQISPESFFQVNPWIAQKIYHRVQQLVGHSRKANAAAWDLYSGVGIFSLIMAKAGYKVMGIEENPFASKDAKQNAERNKMPPKSVSFRDQSVEEFFTESSQKALPGALQHPDVVVVNPSRKGITQEVCDGLIAQKKKYPYLKLIYVSCEAETLGNNIKTLCENGFKLRQIESFDMFPHTDKLEWIAVLD